MASLTTASSSSSPLVTSPADTTAAAARGARLRLAARMFPLNAAAPCRALLQTLRILMTNVAGKGDPKYRTIKLRNKHIKRSVVNTQGGVEFLQAMGFRLATENREQLLKMDEASACDAAWLQRGVQFLDEHLALLDKVASNTNALLAECALIVVLPNGSTMRGAFGFDETMTSVYEWVDTCRTDERARPAPVGPPPFTLSIAYPQRDLPCQHYSPISPINAGGDSDGAAAGQVKTLKMLGLAARQKLIVKKSAREDAPGAFQDNPTERLEREAAMEALFQEKRDREAVAKMAKLKERQAQKKERLQALSSFSDDRDGANRRSSYHVSKMTKG
jgi:hypothetical protein